MHICVCDQFSDIYIFSRNKCGPSVTDWQGKLESSDRQTDIALLVLVRNAERHQPYPLCYSFVCQLKLSTRRCVTLISFKGINVCLSVGLFDLLYFEEEICWCSMRSDKYPVSGKVCVL